MKRRLKKKKAKASCEGTITASFTGITETSAGSPEDMVTPDEPLQLQSIEKKDTPAKEAEAKKRAVKKKAAEAIFVQYRNYEISKKQIETAIKKQWKQSGSPIKDMNTLDMYVKPEEGRVYYLINGSCDGYLQLF